VPVAGRRAGGRAMTWNPRRNERTWQAVRRGGARRARQARRSRRACQARSRQAAASGHPPPGGRTGPGLFLVSTL